MSLIKMTNTTFICQLRFLRMHDLASKVKVVPLIRQGWSIHFETMVIKISVIMPESGLGNGASLPSQWFLKTGEARNWKSRQTG